MFPVALLVIGHFAHISWIDKFMVYPFSGILCRIKEKKINSRVTDIGNTLNMLRKVGRDRILYSIHLYIYINYVYTIYH